jgi:hypothetical protein
MIEPPRESHSEIIRLFVEVSKGRAWPVPHSFTFAEDGVVVKAGGGFIAQYFASQASDTP